MRGQSAGFAVLVRSSRERRPASARDALSIGMGAMEVAATVERVGDRADWLAVSPAESGHEVLVRAALRGPRVGEEEIGNEVSDRATALNASWVSLKADMATAAQAGTVTAAFQQAFLRDWDAWRTFYDAHRGDWVALRTTLGEIETRRVLLERWRTALANAGGTVTGQPTSAPPPGMLEQLGLGPDGEGAGRVGDNVAFIAGAVAVVAVAGVVGLIVLETGKVARRVT